MSRKSTTVEELRSIYWAEINARARKGLVKQHKMSAAQIRALSMAVGPGWRIRNFQKVHVITSAGVTVRPRTGKPF